MEKNIKNIGIIGCSGFIGSNLTHYFNKKNISYVYFSGNLLKNKDIKKFFLRNKVSCAVFLVGTFDPPFENQFKINVLTLQNFLEIGIKYGLKKIILSSSGAVYGEPENKESKETDPLKPNTIYGLTKAYAERCVLYYAQNHNIQYVILRFPNVYGENNKKGVIYNFLSDIKNYGIITIAGDGSQQRNFLHISDACKAIEEALWYKGSDIFNISNPVRVSINDLVKILKSRYAFSVSYKLADNNQKQLLLNTDKAKKLLKFTPKITQLVA